MKSSQLSIWWFSNSPTPTRFLCYLRTSDILISLNYLLPNTWPFNFSPSWISHFGLIIFLTLFISLDFTSLVLQVLTFRTPRKACLSTSDLHALFSWYSFSSFVSQQSQSSSSNFHKFQSERFLNLRQSFSFDRNHFRLDLLSCLGNCYWTSPIYNSNKSTLELTSRLIINIDMAASFKEYVAFWIPLLNLWHLLLRCFCSSPQIPSRPPITHSTYSISSQRANQLSLFQNPYVPHHHFQDWRLHQQISKCCQAH